MLMERDIKESWHKTKQTIERPCKIIFDFDLLDSNDLCEPVARIRSRYEMTANCPDLFHFVEIPWREVSSGCYYCDQIFLIVRVLEKQRFIKGFKADLSELI